MRLRAELRLGRVAGIEIGLHFSWFIIAVLITFSLVGHFHEVTPQWTNAVIWSAALVTAVLFFAALLLHELAHSVVAIALLQISSCGKLVSGTGSARYIRFRRSLLPRSVRVLYFRFVS